jgi:hypothetical protein
VVVIALVGVSVYYWQGVHQVNVEYIKAVRRPSAEWINQNYPAALPIGAIDLGPIGYYADQPVVDLMGHVNKDIVQFRASGGTFADYLEKERLCYLMLSGSMEDNGLDRWMIGHLAWAQVRLTHRSCLYIGLIGITRSIAISEAFYSTCFEGLSE